jgi:hypothetical protein
MRWVLLNEGKSAPITAQASPTWLADVAGAMTVQLNRDLAPNWGGSYSVRAGKDANDVAADECVMALVDDLPQAPDAVAFHSVLGNAQPFALESLNACNTLDDVSKAISHELCEAAGDPYTNLWADGGQGTSYARELCDAVESWGYLINGIQVSDFVLQSFFAVGAVGPYHFLASTGEMPDLAGPFATAWGGYQVVRAEGSTTSQIHGAIAVSRLPKRRHWSSRTYRRGARV